MLTPTPRPRASRLRGFTLIELMIVVAVLAILAVIALPSYQRYIMEARRSDGQAGLQRIQLAQEKWRTNHGSFTTALADLGQNGTSDEGHYTLRVTAASATGYTATATAQGGQAQDTACATMSVTLSNGVNLATTPATCWKK